MSMHKIKVIIMQGVPGSGKSTYVNQMMDKYREATTYVCSADFHFVDFETGVYKFDPSKLGMAHAECMRDFITYLGDATAAILDRCEHVIFVDNTNITVDQMAPYYLVARAFCAEVEIVRVFCASEVAESRNVHGVPLHTIQRMQESMQRPPPYWECFFHEIGGPNKHCG